MSLAAVLNFLERSDKRIGYGLGEESVAVV